MGLISERETISDYGARKIVHVSVCYESNGAKLFAHVNPTLWRLHGLQSIGMPGWAKGESWA